LTHNEGVNVTDIDALYMNEAQTDRYLDWFEDAFVDMRSFMFKQDPDAFTRDVFQLFPLHPSSKPISDPSQNHLSTSLAYQDTVKATQQNLIITEPTLDGDCLRPGQAISQYRNETHLPEIAAKMFYAAVADLICMPVSDLINIVKTTQDAAHRWAARQRIDRREREGFVRAKTKSRLGL
jgi:hypothetical protein